MACSIGVGGVTSVAVLVVLDGVLLSLPCLCALPQLSYTTPWALKTLLTSSALSSRALTVAQTHSFEALSMFTALSEKIGRSPFLDASAIKSSLLRENVLALVPFLHHFLTVVPSSALRALPPSFRLFAVLQFHHVVAMSVSNPGCVPLLLLGCVRRW